MKITPPSTLAEIAKILGKEFSGEENHRVSGINEIHMVEPGDVIFVDHEKYYQKALDSKAGTVIINRKQIAPEGKGLIFSDDPFSDYNKLISVFHYNPKFKEKTNPKIGKNTCISPGAIIAPDVSIGERCVIHPNVVILNGSIIGNDVIIQSNTTIGSDAFYYNKQNGKYRKMSSCGGVLINNHVEIGAGCTIDKGVSGKTVIGEGTKLDNLVHIGHDTVIGKNCLFAAQVGIAGVVLVEDNVTLWGQVGVAANLKIGKNVVVLAQSGIGKDLKENTTYFGSPVSEARQKMKEIAAVKKLPEKIRYL